MPRRVQCGAAQRGTVPCRAVPSRAVQCSAVQCGTGLCSEVLYCVVPALYRAVPCSMRAAVPCRAVRALHRGMARRTAAQHNSAPHRCAGLVARACVRARHFAGRRSTRRRREMARALDPRFKIISAHADGESRGPAPELKATLTMGSRRDLYEVTPSGRSQPLGVRHRHAPRSKKKGENMDPRSATKVLFVCSNVPVIHE